MSAMALLSLLVGRGEANRSGEVVVQGKAELRGRLICVDLYAGPGDAVPLAHRTVHLALRAAASGRFQRAVKTDEADIFALSA